MFDQAIEGMIDKSSMGSEDDKNPLKFEGSSRSSPERIGTGTRRDFLGWITASIMGLIGVVLAIPFVGYIISPALHRRIKDWVDTGNLNDLKLDQPRQISFVVTIQDGWMKNASAKNIWVDQDPNGEIVVFSPLCTHLGCGYYWDQGRGNFICPCHTSIFDRDGTVLAGPAPRPLDRLPVKVVDGHLHVIYKEFKAGTTKQIEL